MKIRFSNMSGGEKRVKGRGEGGGKAILTTQTQIRADMHAFLGSKLALGGGWIRVHYPFTPRLSLPLPPKVSDKVIHLARIPELGNRWIPSS